MRRLIRRLCFCVLGVVAFVSSISTPVGACPVPIPDQLTASETLVLARAVGFPPIAAKRMVQIAQRESNLRPSLVYRAARDESYGLWQVNMRGRLGQAREHQWGIKRAQLLDPAINARMAYRLWREAGEAPWELSR